jgi:hypothetical protein
MSHRGFGRMGWPERERLAWGARMARGRSRAVAIGLAVVGVLAAATPASAETVTFGPNSTLQPFHRWTVPAGVCAATFDLYGAEGSGGVGGARVTSTLAVRPGTAYDIYVGGWGTIGNGGYNGGGDASGGGVGGGGATDVRDGPGLTDRLLVAGGGGGNGGYGSYPETGIGGVGALLGEAGSRSSSLMNNNSYAGYGGGGGTATTGGTAGTTSGGVPGGYAGHAGTLGIGGAGGVPTPPGGDPNMEGGGGGGGLWGGGGGGAGYFDFPGGGGGGGSSLAAGGTVSATSGGNGKAVITYVASPTCTQAGGQAPGGGAPDQTKPTIGGLTFSRTSFRAARSGASASVRRKQAPPVGTKVSFDLSEQSSVKFTVERPAAGRRVNGTCVTPKRSNRGKRSCTRWVTVRGSFGVTGAAGENALTFRGRVGGKSLTPGRYRLTAQATDSAGNASSLRRRSFEIVP